MQIYHCFLNAEGGGRGGPTGLSLNPLRSSPRRRRSPGGAAAGRGPPAAPPAVGGRGARSAPARVATASAAALSTDRRTASDSTEAREGLKGTKDQHLGVLMFEIL